MHWMFLPLKRYADFSGRSRRTEFWMFALGQFLLWFLWTLVVFATVGAALVNGGSPGSITAAGSGFVVLVLVAIVVWLALLIPTLAVNVRRLHDTNRSGWWYGGLLILYAVISVVNLATVSSTAEGGQPSAGGLIVQGVLGLVLLIYGVVLLIFYLLDGTPGHNRYGPDPKGRGHDNAEIFA